jgi:anti-anti-sigma factor
LVTGRATAVAIDLADVGAIDSTGLAILVSASRRFREQGGRVVLRGPAPQLRKILEATGLVRYFEFA